MKIVAILSARPQFIKAAAVSMEIAKHHDIQEIIVHYSNADIPPLRLRGGYGGVIQHFFKLRNCLKKEIGMENIKDRDLTPCPLDDKDKHEIN